MPGAASRAKLEHVWCGPTGQDDMATRWQAGPSLVARRVRAARLQLELLEDALGDGADDEHDERPDAGDVDLVLAPIGCPEDSPRHLLRRGEQLVLRQVRRHRRVHEAR